MKPRDCKPTVEIDDLGPIADIIPHLPGRAQSDQPTVAAGQGLDFGAIRVQGRDSTVDQHQIGRLRHRAATKPTDREQQGSGQ